MIKTQYKKIPKLRFRGFSGKWRTLKLNEAAKINPKVGQLPESFIYIDLDSVKNGQLLKQNRIKRQGAPSRAQRLLQKNDIIFQTVRPYQRNNFFFDRNQIDVVASTGYAQIRTKENPHFLYQFLHTNKFVSDVLVRSTGTNYPAINSNDLAKITINIPYIEEQKRIAEFLGVVDEKTSALEKKKELLEKYKKGVMQKIFTQQIRFKDENGQNYSEWQERQLGQILKESNEKTTKINQYDVLSSTSKGLFLQSEYFKKEIASQDNAGYKILRKNQIVFSPQNLWLGNINMNDCFEVGIVSPSYKIYEIKGANIKYFKQIIKLPRMLYEYAQASEQGASIVRRNLDINSFLSIKIDIPSDKEQEKIAGLLTSLDDKIELENKKLRQAKLFKKSLLQKMFV